MGRINISYILLFLAVVFLTVVALAEIPGASAQNSGQFKVVYTPIYNPLYNEMQQAFKNNGVFEILAEDLNSRFVIPYNVTIGFEECGQANAFYDRTNKSISLCYELPIQLLDDFSFIENDSDRYSIVGNTTVFILYHEAGHALINVLNLPITGKEEDVADQIATYTFVNSGNGDAALSAAVWMDIQAQANSNLHTYPFWDQHSFSEERFFNVICWVYGSNEAKYSYLVPDILPQQRALTCKYEYQQMNNSLNTLFKPYLRIQNITAKGDLNNNGIVADAGDLVLMKRASIDEIPADSSYDLNNNGISADAGDLVLMKRASIGEINLL